MEDEAQSQAIGHNAVIWDIRSPAWHTSCHTLGPTLGLAERVSVEYLLAWRLNCAVHSRCTDTHSCGSWGLDYSALGVSETLQLAPIALCCDGAGNSYWVAKQQWVLWLFVTSAAVPMAHHHHPLTLSLNY